MGKLESPAVRWAVAFIFLGVELLLFVAVADLALAQQVVIVIMSIFLFAIIPSILKEFSEKGTSPIESTQQRRAALAASVVDKIAEILRIDKTAPFISWIAAVFLIMVAIGTITDSVSALRIRGIVSAAVYLLLATFAAPPVRHHLREEYQLGFSRWVIVITLITGVMLNEEIVAPPEETPAVILAGLGSVQFY